MEKMKKKKKVESSNGTTHEWGRECHIHNQMMIWL